MSITERKHVSEIRSDTGRRLEIFTGFGRRRSWSVDQKAAIVAQSYDGSASVCDVARQHGLTPSQLFAWRREARLPPDTLACVCSSKLSSLP
jgi:transposase